MAPDRGRAFVIFNPAAAGGRGAKRIPRYLELLDRHLPHLDHGISSRPGEEASLAETAIRDGYDTVIAVGGDGTWSAVADRILSLGRPGVTLGILPAGTGNDFGRNLGVPGDDPETAVRILSAGHRTRVDVGRILGGTRHEEREVEPREIRFFLNVVGLGFDVAVVDEAKRTRFLSGEVLYKVAALKQLFRFPGFSVTLEAEGGQPRSGPTLMLTITNGKFFGGGFPISPGASLEDGALHACHIRDTGPLRRARLFLQAGKGRHESSAEVDSQTASRFRLAFPRPVRFEVDGDVHTTTGDAISVEVCKGGLSVLAPEM